jgi:phosphate starvation-inducible membrane PsiE
MAVIVISGAILLLSLATLLVRFGSSKFPSAQSEGSETR